MEHTPNLRRRPKSFCAKKKMQQIFFSKKDILREMKHACPTRIQGQASTNNMPKMKFPREECRKIDQSNTKEVSRRASLSQHHEKERGGGGKLGNA